MKAHFSHQQPTRVAVIVRGNSEYREQPPSTIIDHVLSMLGTPETEVLYLAREDWGRTVHLVFDLYHASYNFHEAHVVDEMRVIMVTLGGKQERKSFASSSEAALVNDRIAKLHNYNGWETWPPFFADHSEGAVPTYDSPRDMRDMTS
jgi:hypothetical protein